jgi:hypothetical protein
MPFSESAPAPVTRAATMVPGSPRGVSSTRA